MSPQVTTELHHTVVSSVFLPNIACHGDAFIVSLSDLVVLEVEANDATKIFIIITEQDSGRGCLLDAKEYPLSFGRRATTLVSWGCHPERLELLLIFPTRQAAWECRCAVQGDFLDWVDECGNEA